MDARWLRLTSAQKLMRSRAVMKFYLTDENGVDLHVYEWN